MRQARITTLALWLALGACGGTTENPGATGASASGAAGTGGASSTGVGAGGATSTGVGAGGASTCTDPAAKACTGAGQCALATPDCCLCGMPELGDFVAVTEEAVPGCVCMGPACDCATELNPNLAASCEAGACVGWDVRQEDQYSACKTADDCQLRAGLDCCEPCQGDAYALVAVRVDVEPALKTALCAPDEACSKCAVQYPPEASAQCVAGHCAVVFAN